MQDEYSIPQVDTLSKEEIIEEIPTHEEIITAPEADWRRLCSLADADPGMMLAMRIRRQLKESGQEKAKPRRQARRSRSSTSTRNWSASSVLQSQARIGSAMVETLDRVNSGELDGDGESRSILITSGNEFQVMEVVT